MVIEILKDLFGNIFKQTANVFNFNVTPITFDNFYLNGIIIF
jgi:hypothetical protein